MLVQVFEHQQFIGLYTGLSQMFSLQNACAVHCVNSDSRQQLKRIKRSLEMPLEEPAVKSAALTAAKMWRRENSIPEGMVRICEFYDMLVSTLITPHDNVAL